jgi:hypothetical protein
MAVTDKVTTMGYKNEITSSPTRFAIWTAHHVHVSAPLQRRMSNSSTLSGGFDATSSEN